MPKLVRTEETKDQGKVAVANNHHGAAALHDHMPPGSEMATGSRLDRFVWEFTDLHVRRPLTTFFSCGFVIMILVIADKKLYNLSAAIDGKRALLTAPLLGRPRFELTYVPRPLRTSNLTLYWLFSSGGSGCDFRQLGQQ